MAEDLSLWRSTKPSTVTVDDVDAGGIYGKDGIVLIVDGEDIEITNGLSLATKKRIAKARKVSLKFSLLELTPGIMAKILNAHTAATSTVLTGDIDQNIAEHTIAVALVLSDGAAWIIEGDCFFLPKMELTLNGEDVTKLPVEAEFIPDTDNDNLFFTLTETPAEGGAMTVASTVPTDNAGSVVVSADLTVTFSRAIQVASVSSKNFKLIKTTDGTAPVIVLTYDPATFTVTINPSGSLSASTIYNLIIDARINPLVGPRMAADSIVNFTTA